MIALLRWVWRHVGLVAEVGAYAFWLLFDLVVALGHTGPSRFLALAAATVVPTLVLLRRRPGTDLVAVASAALAVSVGLSTFVAFVGSPGAIEMSFTELLALAILVIEVLRRCPLRTALVLTAVGAIAILGSPIQRAGDLAVGTGYAVMCALGWGGAVGIGLLLRDVDTRRRAALEEVRAAERMELARELHDVVAHHVTGIVVAAQAAAVVARTSPDEVDHALAAIEAAGSDALAAMRRMVGVLRGGGEATRTPGAERLASVLELVQRFDPQRRLVRLTNDPGLEHAVLPAGVAATAHRVVQEALTNVRRHAPAVTTVEVELRIRDGVLLVSVRNDGVPSGRQATGAGGFGLAGMSERVAALGGSLTAGPTGPDVWTVSARLPLGGTP